jgi:hypothetical protein
VLRAGGHGAIAVSTRAGAYVRFGADHVFLCRVGAPFGPLSLGVTGLDAIDLRPGVAVVAAPGALVVGAAPISLDRLRARGGVLTCDRGTSADPAIVTAVRRRLPPPPAAIATGLRSLHAGDLRAALDALAGRGAGLTPDGDDVLAGYAAWRWASGDPVALAATATRRCSPIGLSYLRCAERGELPAPAAALLEAVRSGDSTAALAALPSLRRWGSSSGAALAHGILTAASARSGGQLRPNPQPPS